MGSALLNGAFKGLELAINPFLRAEDPAVQAHLGMVGAAPADVFAEIRERKNRF